MAESTAAEIEFEIYGLRVRVNGDWPEVVEALKRDFIWFPRSSGKADVTVRIRRRAPDLAHFGALEATAITWRSAEYRNGRSRIVDYLGQALSVDDGGGAFAIDGTHGWFVWRACYEHVLGMCGRHFDRIGLTRVDGLGLGGDVGGTLVILPSGGGKTTLALSALSAGRQLISEGSPLLDGEAQLHPFPVPLLVRATSSEAATLPQQHVRRLEGIDPDPVSLEVAAFADHVPATPLPLRNVVFAARSLAEVPLLRPVTWRSVAWTMARVTIGGHGLLEGEGMTHAPQRLWTARRRSAAYLAATRRADPWHLRLGLDKDANWRALDEIL